MKKLALLGILVLQGIALSGHAAPGYATKAESSATENFGKNGPVQQTVNTSFSFTTFYDPKSQSYQDGLYSQQVETTLSDNKSKVTHKLQTAAFVDGKSKYSTKLWTIEDCADSGWQAGDFYVTSSYGVDGQENMLRAYNLQTGKYAFSFTVNPVTVEIAIPRDTVKRYASYLSKKGADSECHKNDLPAKAAGKLILASDSAATDEIMFESDDNTLTRSPTISLVDSKHQNGASELSIWGPADFANKSDVVDGFSVRVEFRPGVVAIIPVNNDKFDVQKATLPAGIKISR